MGGLAQILSESGHEVSGSDIKFYPPMSEFLEATGIKTFQGYEKNKLPDADLYVIGNALSRGNMFVDQILERKEMARTNRRKDASEVVKPNRGVKKNQRKTRRNNTRNSIKKLDYNDPNLLDELEEDLYNER